ncbi:exonuclease 3'-5' domain-containing protein 2-like [Chironomus tepperi]|uniref:exonuclease 3'-5' domain-containing protein 2-like n=1 Tax=Chironomus tepperi TaxID=113505 RepID=UPI00391EFB92
MTTNKSDKVTKLLLTAAGVGVCTFLLIKNRKTIVNKLIKAKDVILYDIAKVQRRSFSVHIVNDPEDCAGIVNILKEHCKSFNVLGFDCEWVTVNNQRRKVALIQLCSDKGLCALFRVCKFNKIPLELREILQDPEIMKVGIASVDDSNKLFQDYAIKVNGTFDIRFLALLANHKAEGLAKLSKSILNIELDKNWRITCSDWESPILSKAQIDYAAKDSFVAVEIFKNLYNIVRPNMNNPSKISQFCDTYTDINFKNKLAQSNLDPANENGIEKKLFNRKKEMSKVLKRSYTKSTNLYDNCFLQAPDSTLLCTCDRKKAEWYVSKGLGTLVESEPTFTVRLNFKPAGMPVGEVGEYYQAKKENKCVVCGREDELIRKNVVPHEYRRYFPIVMKEKSSHDICLLCFHCHQISNMSDIKIKRMLEAKCDAPIYELPHNEDDLKKFRYIQRSARALLNQKIKIPEQRRTELEKIVQAAYPDKTLTTDFLNEIVNESEPQIEHKTSHGELVVDFYKKNDGLIELEKIFRQHFLDTMQPQFMPKLWNINHNANRLGIRALEQRIDQKDLEVAGINEKIIQDVQSSINLYSESSKNEANVMDKIKQEDDTISVTSFKSAVESLNWSDKLNKTDDDNFFSDTATITSFYETIRSDGSELTDFQSFENSSNEDSDTSTAKDSGSETEVEEGIF